MKSSERTFVLRIYRADKSSAQAVGMVEDCLSGKKTAFSSFDELVLLLSGKKRPDEPDRTIGKKSTRRG